jgi:V/A-type H+-transporting ATPase subunit E
MISEQERSSGVQELIDRLREQGVEEGKEEADQLVADARRRAADTLDQARREADEIVQNAREEADRLRAAGEDALRLAGRDAMLALKEEVSDQFGGQVRRLVSACLRDEQFMQRLILEIAGRAAPKETEGRVELLLPEDMVSPKDLEGQPKEVKEGTLSHFVLGLAGETLREGVTCAAAPDNTPGVTVRLVDEDVEINFNEQALTQFLLRHLLPRFRALMHGIASET